MVNYVRKKFNHLQKLRRYEGIYQSFRGHTMVPENWYITNLLLAEKVLDQEGAIVECGVWKGGMIGGIAKILGPQRHYYLYDSFEGLPDAQEIDGQRALDWQNNTESPTYYDNCKAAVEDAERAMQIAGARHFEISKGWFENTLPQYSGGTVALLRLDGDWYDSTMTCLKEMYPRVKKGGIIIVDDYYFWDGCARAIHDYLSEHQATARIKTFNNQVCWLKKY
ncbi:MAG: TylF/MycF/NovP-related O-methyltransferase [Bacteroidota bacterium]